MLQTVKTKIPIKLIVFLCILAMIIIAIASFYIIRKTAFNRAYKALDVTDTATVTKLLKYGSKDSDTVFYIAEKFDESGDKQNATKLCLYILQYLDSSHTGATEYLTDCGFESFEFGEIKKDFKVTTSYGTDSYASEGGIYCEFFEGYCKAKISPVRALDLYADEGGLYFLDSSDSLIKFMDSDGTEIKVKLQLPVSEFIYYESQLYYIDKMGVPFADKQISLAEGETAMNLRVDSGRVCFTVYDSDFEELRDQYI